VIRSDIAWALGRALRFAVGTCVIALILATTLSGETSERFASTAYVAAIFAALTLAAGRFFPSTAQARRASGSPFPSFLSYSIGLTIFLSFVAAFVSQPGAEMIALVACGALIVIAILVRCGAMARFNAALTSGGAVAGLTRYAVLVGVGAFVVAALLSSDASESVAIFAYRVMLVAGLLLCTALLAPTSAGAFVRRTWTQTANLLDRQARAFVFERTASYAAIVAIAAMLPASLLPPPFAEPFAVTAYLAAACAAFGVAMECRRLRS
jgi:hypothetical protein